MTGKDGNGVMVVALPEENPWKADDNHVGQMTVRELVDLVLTPEFGKSSIAA